MKVAIFGGSFDPPHRGHRTIVTKALEELDIDLLLIVPTYLNPFKESFTAPPQLRLRWLKKLFLTEKRVRVLDFEVRQGRQVYAIESVTYIQRRLRPKKIYYLIGSDNLPSLPRWREFRRLDKKVEFIVFTRGRRIPKSRYKTISLNLPISSTMIRRRVRRRLLPKPIAPALVRFYRRAIGRETPQSGTSADRARS
ncbi:MAG: nicotinate (nicotinamide) nucleotide adenylyltransferase [Epsilonproteobacteria bacterium]|nr:nicotinate (nicotinamide) nucleotide adenylyltransferase [Campylobacterota bacterium]NPA56815.1 nicotinate (nicotinamide) nucleotide adenylyltransferase [Campylobacterota bacterium]